MSLFHANAEPFAHVEPSIRQRCLDTDARVQHVSNLHNVDGHDRALVEWFDGVPTFVPLAKANKVTVVTCFSIRFIALSRVLFMVEDMRRPVKYL